MCPRMQVESTLFDTVRSGTLPDSFQRFAVIYGGVASGATAGILALGPSQDYPGVRCGAKREQLNRFEGFSP